ncbi:hypothetical protein AMECASPLE_003006 [Ameca splendens]|uniref:Uncharacterized protein n=1 Tax=Ameca splendens TaxID=208324 RepID=A0ABV0XYG4_9TELE
MQTSQVKEESSDSPPSWRTRQSETCTGEWTCTVGVRRFPDVQNTNMDRVVVEVPISNAPRKRQVRFSARHDIILLREVITQNPLGSKEPGRMWARIGENITAALQEENFEVDARRCRERTMLLLDYYKKQDFPRLRRFGTEKLYAQKEDLLHEVLELEAEKGLLVSGEGCKYQVRNSGTMIMKGRHFEQFAVLPYSKKKSPTF